MRLPVVVDHGRVLAPLLVGSKSIYAMIDTGCNYMSVTESVAKEAFRLASAKLGLRCRFLKRDAH